jgi:glycerophosphoryl diester phosphodiesterase
MKSLAFLFLTMSISSAQPIIIAHRGASGELPEHTLAAKAVAHAQGAHFIEQDVVLTKDKVPVVLHDIHVDTVSDVKNVFPRRHRDDGRFYALDFTLAELKTLRFTERFHHQTGQPVYPTRFPLWKSAFSIATLEEELELIAGLNASSGRKVGIYPEIKQPQWHRQQDYDISEIVIGLLRKHGYEGKADACWLQCFEWAEVQRIRHELKWEGRLLLLLGSGILGKDGTHYAHFRTSAGMEEAAKVVDGLGPDIGSLVTGSSPADRRMTEFMPSARRAGLVVHPYTLRKDDLQQTFGSFEDGLDVLLHQSKVDGLFTDHPGPAIQWLNQ